MPLHIQTSSLPHQHILTYITQSQHSCLLLCMCSNTVQWWGFELPICSMGIDALNDWANEAAFFYFVKLPLYKVKKCNNFVCFTTEQHCIKIMDYYSLFKYVWFLSQQWSEDISSNIEGHRRACTCPQSTSSNLFALSMMRQSNQKKSL